MPSNLEIYINSIIFQTHPNFLTIAPYFPFVYYVCFVMGVERDSYACDVSQFN